MSVVFRRSHSRDRCCDFVVGYRDGHVPWQTTDRELVRRDLSLADKF